MKRKSNARLNQDGSAVILETWLSDNSNTIVLISLQEAKALAKELIKAVVKSSDRNIK